LAEKAVRRRWRDRWRQSLAGPERYDGHDALSEISLPAILTESILTEWAYTLKAGTRHQPIEQQILQVFRPARDDAGGPAGS
jgi:hypothetical protein